MEILKDKIKDNLLYFIGTLIVIAIVSVITIFALSFFNKGKNKEKELWINKVVNIEYLEKIKSTHKPSYIYDILRGNIGATTNIKSWWNYNDYLPNKVYIINRKDINSNNNYTRYIIYRAFAYAQDSQPIPLDIKKISFDKKKEWLNFLQNIESYKLITEGEYNIYIFWDNNIGVDRYPIIEINNVNYLGYSVNFIKQWNLDSPNKRFSVLKDVKSLNSPIWKDHNIMETNVYNTDKGRYSVTIRGEDKIEVSSPLGLLYYKTLPEAMQFINLKVKGVSK